jgi:hypothetical protein
VARRTCSFIGALAGALLAALPVRAEAPSDRPAAVANFHLGNGMEVVVIPDHRA